MTAATAHLRPQLARRRRELITPEGLALPLTIASRGARAGALLLDLALIFGAMILIFLALIFMGLGAIDLNAGTASPAVEAILVLLILTVFLSRYGYFLWFELGPRASGRG